MAMLDAPVGDFQKVNQTVKQSPLTTEYQPSLPHGSSAIADEGPVSSRTWFSTVQSLSLAQRVLQTVGLLSCCFGGALLAYGLLTRTDLLVTLIGVSTGMMAMGCFVFLRAEFWFGPDICFDREAQELRLVRRLRNGQEVVLLRRQFESLGGVRLEARKFHVLERDGSPLMQMPIPNREMRAFLREGLSGELPILS